MKLKRLVLALTVAAALACTIALVGCGGADQYKDNFVGSYKLTEIQSTKAENATSASDMKMMESFMGTAATMTLDKDGKASLDIFGTKTETKWSPNSETECTIDNQKCTLKDGVLTMSDGTDTLIFAKQ